MIVLKLVSIWYLNCCFKGSASESSMQETLAFFPSACLCLWVENVHSWVFLFTLSCNTCGSSSHSWCKFASQKNLWHLQVCKYTLSSKFHLILQYIKREICLQTNNVVGWKILEVLYQPKAWSYLKIQMPALTVKSWFHTVLAYRGTPVQLLMYILVPKF